MPLQRFKPKSVIRPKQGNYQDIIPNRPLGRLGIMIISQNKWLDNAIAHFLLMFMIFFSDIFTMFHGLFVILQNNRNDALFKERLLNTHIYEFLRR